jgi:hypothetical protein
VSELQRQLAGELIRDGTILGEATGETPPELHFYLALAHHKRGEFTAAVAHCVAAVPYAEQTGADLLLQVWTDALIKQDDQAGAWAVLSRRFENRLLEQSRQALRERFEAVFGRPPGIGRVESPHPGSLRSDRKCPAE